MTAGHILLLGQVYLGVGAILALPFLTFGINRIDENVRGAWVFRAMMVPGVMMIWPIVAWRWLQIERGAPDPQAPYRPPFRLQTTGFLVIAIAIPALVFTALVVRQDGPFEAPAQMIEAPN